LGGVTPVHEWVLPRLTALVRDAEKAGFDRATIVAVVTDLITAPPFNVAGPMTEDFE
jgi:hypothetical protein